MAVGSAQCGWVAASQCTLPSRVFAGGGPAPLFAQDTVQIGNQLPGLRMRSLVVGGVSEDKVSVRRGFRGCLQVPRASSPTPALGLHGGLGGGGTAVGVMIVLLVFRKRVCWSNRPPNLNTPYFPLTALLLPVSPRALHCPPGHPIVHLQPCFHVPSRASLWLPAAAPVLTWTGPTPVP